MHVRRPWPTYGLVSRRPGAGARGGGNRRSRRRRTCGVSLPHCGLPLGVHMTYNTWAAAGWGRVSAEVLGCSRLLALVRSYPDREVLCRIPSEARSDIRTLVHGIGRPGIATAGGRYVSVKGMDFQCGAKQVQKEVLPMCREWSRRNHVLYIVQGCQMPPQ